MKNKPRILCSKLGPRLVTTICPQPPEKLLLYANDRARLNTMREAARNLGKPAAASIAEGALRLVLSQLS